MDQVELEARVRRDLPWNFCVSLLDMVFITLAATLVSRDTIVPLLVSRLTKSTTVIGLIPALWALGLYLPQLLIANYAERLPCKKPFSMLVGALGERLPYFLMGLIVWLFAVRAPSVALTGLLLLITISAAGIGLALPPWFDMIAKVIPVRQRGLRAGVGRSAGALLGVAGALLAGRILQRVAFPSNFALCYAMAGVAAYISWTGLALTREPPSLVTKPRLSLGKYLRRLPAVIRQNRNYARFLVARGVGAAGNMALGFYMVYAVARFPSAAQQVGSLTAILIGSQAVMNLVWGAVGDRFGHKLVLCGGQLSMGLAAVMALWLPTVEWLPVLFAIVGAATTADMVSGSNIVIEFCAAEDRPTYIGLTNTLLAPVRMLAPLLAGWLAGSLGYPAMFGTVVAVCACGALALALWVREPRTCARAGASPAGLVRR